MSQGGAEARRVAPRSERRLARVAAIAWALALAGQAAAAGEPSEALRLTRQ